MQLIQAHKQLLDLQQPIIETRDAAACLQTSVMHAAKILKRLSDQGLVTAITRGLWGLAADLDPLMLPGYLTRPNPSYISLQTALYFHGIIEQIPQVTYAVSLARSRRVETALGVISIHHIQAELFGGQQWYGDHAVLMATPEKALLDICYLSQNKTQLFAALPEVELPANFDWDVVTAWITKISDQKRRRRVAEMLQNFEK